MECFPVPDSAEGLQMKLKEMLTEQVSRLSGDGTHAEKYLQLVNVTYIIIN